MHTSRVTSHLIKHIKIFNRHSYEGKERFQLFTCFERMAHIDNPAHMDRTASNTRDKVSSVAVVTEMADLSPTVKGLTLRLEDAQVRFKAGQWVDFFIPDVSIFTGYSMYSSPLQLERHQTLELAVKATDYAPTFWVHHKCKVGSEVTVRVGGDFYYDPQPDTPECNLLLLAGGVGINPMLSMIHHASDLHEKLTAGETVHQPGKVLMLYSAAKYEELIFKEQIKELCKHKDIDCWYYVTQEEVTAENNNVSHHRISESSIQAAVQSLNSSMDSISCYICGPGPMIDTMEQHLIKQGLPHDCIHYEKWW